MHPHSIPPAHTAPSDPLLDAIVEEFVALLERGSEPSVDDFLRRYPERAEALRNLLPAARVMASLGQRDAAEVSRTEAESPQPLGLRELGDFRLIRELGRGGMGVVYEAEQLSLGRRIALKVLPFATVLDPRHLQRFKHEARAAATLDHPHIVHVHSVGQERGVHFYAMQLIEGQSLAEVLNELRDNVPVSRDGESSERTASPDNSLRSEDSPSRQSHSSTVRGQRLSTAIPQPGSDYFRQVARWGIQAAEALEYAHQLGVVHRDIKPSNLLVNAEGDLWVADFGLAMTRADSGLTMTGDVLGTLRYMSPEQALGQRGVVDQRSDVYSLGITLYELLALRPAFPEFDRAQLLRQIEQDDPPPLRQHAKTIPVEIETMISKAIDKDPNARYATAQQFADDLRRFLNDLPIRAQPPAWRDRLVKWSRRHRTLVRSLAAAACVSLLAAAASTVLVVRARHQTELERVGRQADAAVATAARQNARLQQYLVCINLADRALVNGDADEARAQLLKCVPTPGMTDLRGVEWHYLYRRTAPQVTVVGRHQGSAYHVQTSPAGDLLASCGKDGIRIWDVQTNRPLRHLTAHTSEVNRTGFSPDGRLLVSTGDDGVARIWDTQTWQVVQALPHTGPAIGGNFTPDGRWLLTAERRDELTPGEFRGQNVGRIWDVNTWQPVTTLEGHQDRISEVELSDDGATYVSADRLGTVNVWSVPDGALLRSFQHFGGEPYTAGGVIGIGLAHRQPWIVTTGHLGSAHLWQLPSGRPLTRLSTAMSGLRCAAFSPDDRYLLVGGDGDNSRTISAWALLADGQIDHMHSIRVSDSVWWLSFLNANEVAIADDSGEVVRWTIERPGNLQRYRAKSAETFAQAAVSPDSRWLVHTTSGLAVKSLAGSGDSTRDHDVMLDAEFPGFLPVAFSPDSQYLVSARQTVCTIWNTANWQPVRTLPPTPKPISDILFADNGARLGLQLEVPFNHPSPYSWFEFPSGAAASEPPSARFETSIRPSSRRFRRNGISAGEMVEAGQVLWHRTGVEVGSSLLSVDETVVALEMQDGRIEICDAATGDVNAVCLVPHGRGGSLAFSADGRTLASCREPKLQITLWHVATGNKLLDINPGFRSIRTLTFTPDGKHLVVAGANLAGYGETLLIRCDNSSVYPGA